MNILDGSLHSMVLKGDKPYMLKVVSAAAAVCIVFAIIKSRHIVKYLFFSAIEGLTALFAVNFIGEFIGVGIRFNWFSLAAGVIGGIPGIIYLLVCDILAAALSSLPHIFS